MPQKELKNYLTQLKKEDLIKEIEKLYKKFKPVQEYYSMELSRNTGNVLEKYKTQLCKEYFPERGYGRARASVARNIISEFTKISVFDIDLIELMLYRVELCVEFTKSYGDITESFYTSAENAFDRVCKLIVKNKHQDQFIERCTALVNNTRNCGWGFYDTLSDIFYEYFKREL